MARAKKYLRNEKAGDDFVRCWREGSSLIVQVWLGQSSASGDPEGDWCMPGVLGTEAAVAQAILQTKAGVK